MSKGGALVRFHDCRAARDRKASLLRDRDTFDEVEHWRALSALKNSVSRAPQS
jgi:hypothetical protein